MLIFCEVIYACCLGICKHCFAKPVGSLGKHLPLGWPRDKCIKLCLGPGGTLDFKHPFYLQSGVPPLPLGHLGFQYYLYIMHDGFI